MKRLFSTTFSLRALWMLMFAASALVIAGCTNNSSEEPTTTEPVQTTGQASAIVKGEGENAFVFIAVDSIRINVYSVQIANFIDC